MNLHDPSRPQIQHKPAFLTGSVVIPQLIVWPLSNPDLVEVSCMLPVSGAGPFTSKQFKTEIKIEKLSELLIQFRGDPETTLSNLFGADPTGFVPAISIEPDPASWAREQKKSRERESAPKPRTKLLEEFSLL